MELGCLTRLILSGLAPPAMMLLLMMEVTILHLQVVLKSRPSSRSYSRGLLPSSVLAKHPRRGHVSHSMTCLSPLRPTMVHRMLRSCQWLVAVARRASFCTTCHPRAHGSCSLTAAGGRSRVVCNTPCECRMGPWTRTSPRCCTTWSTVVACLRLMATTRR